MVRYRGARRDEPGLPAHEFYQSQAVVNATRFSVCTVEDFDRFLNRRQVTESARDKRHVVVDRFRKTYDRKGVASLLGLLKELVAATDAQRWALAV